jgi:hypothetical protein
MFFGMVGWVLHHEVRIRSSPSYHRYSGASSVGGGLVESCAWFISWDSVGFHVPCSGFRSVSYYLQLSSLTMVIASVC